MFADILSRVSERFFDKPCKQSVTALTLIGFLIAVPAIPAVESRLWVDCQDGRISVRAAAVPAIQLLERIERDGHVEFDGFDQLKDRPVSITINREPMDSALKRILPALGVRNFALEYDAGLLRRVRIFPEANPVLLPGKTEPPNSSGKDRAQTSVVEVRQIVEGSQAQKAGLKTGDWILAYDGVPVHSAAQLKAETEKRSKYQSAEVEVLREGRRIRFYLDGGFIGIRINTRNFSAERLEHTGE